MRPQVDVDLDPEAMTITVRDDGVGMDLADVNDKFLYVGYSKRGKDGDECLTPLGRKPMGRKGIGKLSLFAIANRISVYTKKADAQPESFLLDGHRIKEAIEAEDPSTQKVYAPQRIDFDRDIRTKGTILYIHDLKKARITRSTFAGLRKRIARRFSVFGDDFRVRVNGEEVTFHDRDYFHRARFLYQYDDDYIGHCANLDRDAATGEPMGYDRPFRFRDDGQIGEHSSYAIRGWIAIARRSNDARASPTLGGLEN